MPQSARWAVERFAESVTVLADDEESVQLHADLLPPVASAARAAAALLRPRRVRDGTPTLLDAAETTARQLLDHHARDA